MSENQDTPPSDPHTTDATEDKNPPIAGTDPVDLTAAPKVQETITTGLGHFFQAMEKGAASVYHRIVQAEQIVVAWESNPAVKALVDEGVSLGTAFLIAHGIPVASFELAGSAVWSSLKALAAADPSINSAAKS